MCSILTPSVSEGTSARKVRLAHARGEEAAAHVRKRRLFEHERLADSRQGKMVRLADAPSRHTPYRPAHGRACARWWSVCLPYGPVVLRTTAPDRFCPGANDRSLVSVLKEEAVE